MTNDLISRSALVNDLIGNRDFYPAIVKRAIEQQPAIDAVEVVRCKDCVSFYCCSAVDRDFYCRHQSGLKRVTAIEEDSFCSYGKRKESEVIK